MKKVIIIIGLLVLVFPRLESGIWSSLGLFSVFAAKKVDSRTGKNFSSMANKVGGAIQRGGRHLSTVHQRAMLGMRSFTSVSLQAEAQEQVENTEKVILEKINHNDATVVRDLVTALERGEDLSWIKDLNAIDTSKFSWLIYKECFALSGGVVFNPTLKLINKEACQKLLEHFKDLCQQDIVGDVFEKAVHARHTPFFLRSTSIAKKFLEKFIDLHKQDCFDVESDVEYNPFSFSSDKKISLPVPESVAQEAQKSVIPVVNARAADGLYTLTNFIPSKKITEELVNSFEKIAIQKDDVFIAIAKWLEQEFNDQQACALWKRLDFSYCNPAIVFSLVRKCKEGLTTGVHDTSSGNPFANVLMGKEATQTEYHLKDLLMQPCNKYYWTHENLSIARYVRNPRLMDFAIQVNNKARELEEQGYVTFVHGQQWSYEFLSDIYTYLRQLLDKEDKHFNDFTFVHVKDPKAFADKKEQEALHAALLRNDLQGFIKEKEGSLQVNGQAISYKDLYRSILFLNYAFFANEHHDGSSTAEWIASNNSERPVDIDLAMVFNDLGFAKIYDKHKSEIESLQKKHAALTQHGNCLLVAVPRGQLDKTIVPVNMHKDDAGRFKASDIITGLRNGKKTITNLNWIEFYMPMTAAKHGGMNPKNGIKIFSFNAGKEQEVQAYKNERDALFRAMRAECTQSK